MRKYPVDDYLVREDVTIRQALERIERTERRTVFVVDADRHLVGSVTDGDVRRWLLEGGNVGADLRQIVNPHPLTVGQRFESADLRDDLMRLGATCCPVLDGQRRVVDIVFWEDVFLGPVEVPAPRPVDAPVVIMAGGRGTRMAPFTQVLPKPLLPVGEKTVIELIIERFVQHGVRDFHLTLGHQANLIRAFFADLPRGYAVDFVEEESPLGTAGALDLLRDRLTRPFILTNCDIVIESDYHDIVTHHHAQENLVTMVVSLKQYDIPYGVCEIETGGRLLGIDEKPSFDLLVNTGMYVVSPAALDHLEAGEPCQMPALIERVQDAGGRVGVFPIGAGAWLDTGEWAAYRETLRHFESRLR